MSLAADLEHSVLELHRRRRNTLRGVRLMHLHEYQSKELLAKRGVQVPRGSLCYDPLEGLIAARQLRSDKVVLKAQVHAGGRGKAGAVAVVSMDEDIRARAAEVLGKRMVTEQTGPQGKPVSALLVEEVLHIDKEMYLGIILSRGSARITIMASPFGGVDIETLARDKPDQIYTTQVHPLRGLTDYKARAIAYRLSDSKKIATQIMDVIAAMYNTFLELDCSLVEINPLIVSGERVVALDAKITLDDSGLFRHPEMELWRDRSQEDSLELSAKKDGLSYIKLDGNIGCIVNGAGLAMATLDLISLHGGAPANFLDVGGGASEQVVGDAMSILLDDNRVKVIFINIFGGILRCDVLARGVIRALRRQQVAIPVIARIEGTNIHVGRRLFEESGLPVQMIGSLDEAAKRAVEVAKTV